MSRFVTRGAFGSWQPFEYAVFIGNRWCDALEVERELADPNLLEVAQTIFGLSPATSATNIDAQAKALSQLMPISDLQDPKTLQQLTERFTATYDLTYGPGSGATTFLTVSSDNSGSSQSGASAVLADVINSNGQSISSALNTFSGAPTPMFSNELMSSLQKFPLGG